MSLFGPPDIEKLKAKRDVNGLMKAADYQRDNQIRKDAIKALGEFKCGEAFNLLCKALKEQELAQTAANALADLGDTRAMDVLGEALKDQELSKFAAKALAKLGDTRAIEPLIEIIKTDDKYYSEAANEAGGLLAKIGTPAVEPIVEALACNKYHAMVQFVNALAKIGGSRAYEAILSVFYWQQWPEGEPDEGRPLVAIAALALGNLGDAQAVEPLIAELTSPRRSSYNDLIGLAVTEALGMLKDSRSVEPLISALDSMEVKIAQGAATALGKIGDVRAIEPLKNKLNDRFVDYHAKKAIAEIEKKNNPS